jgi:hypothetical protein
VCFDGFRVGVLLVAKGPRYGVFADQSQEDGFTRWFANKDKLQRQGKSQLGIARTVGYPVVWHIADTDFVAPVAAFFEREGLADIKLVHTPYQP